MHISRAVSASIWRSDKDRFGGVMTAVTGDDALLPTAALTCHQQYREPPASAHERDRHQHGLVTAPHHCRQDAGWASLTPYTWAEKFESFERINSKRETNGNFDSCNSCKRLGTSRLHELHESKFPFVSRIEFIRSKLSNFSAHVYGATERASCIPSCLPHLHMYTWLGGGYRWGGGIRLTLNR